MLSRILLGQNLLVSFWTTVKRGPALRAAVVTAQSESSKDLLGDGIVGEREMKHIIIVSSELIEVSEIYDFKVHNRCNHGLLNNLLRFLEDASVQCMNLDYRFLYVLKCHFLIND